VLLRGLHFVSEDGQKYVELPLLIGRVTSRCGDKALGAFRRQLGWDEKNLTSVEGVRELAFSSICGCVQGFLRSPQRICRGLQVAVRELAPECLELARTRDLLAAVAGALAPPTG